MITEHLKYLFILIAALLLLPHCTLKSLPEGEQADMLAHRLLQQHPQEPDVYLSFTHPYEGSVFPPDLAAPVFSWKDKHPESDTWLIAIEMNGRQPVYRFSSTTDWVPEKGLWEKMKSGSVDTPATVTLVGLNNSKKPIAVSKKTLRFTTSNDPVDAMVLFRQVRLPFKAGETSFRKLKWRLGDIASYDEPTVVMENIPVCASCHQVTPDGKTFSMEMNYKNDSGAQLVAPVNNIITLSENDFITWNEFPKPELLPNTRGLFGTISPTGIYLAATVNEISYAALTNDPAFCQLFFPTYGIIGVYTTDKKTFRPLSGADNTGFVQTNPVWSPDESTLAFARSKTMNHYHGDIGNIKTHIEDAGIDELNRKFPIQFDIVTVPFNQGDGGSPTLLKGASGNGKSNYFPRYSPDGKWIVFTRSNSGIMLQPDSELYIVPAEGGVERRMACNRSRMNSWHSFSPNGRWLLFSSKANTMYTEIFLTHIDENGMDSPPVCLTRFSDDTLAANVPEFVNLRPGELESIMIRDK